MAIFHQLPDSVLQLLAVFLSIIIEALPFVLLGSILSGFIEVFVTPEKVQNWHHAAVRPACPRAQPEAPGGGA